MRTKLSREEVISTVTALAADLVGVDRAGISAETHLLQDLNFDSLDVVEFIMKVEEAFELTIPDEKAEVVRTIGDAVDVVCRLLDG